MIIVASEDSDSVYYIFRYCDFFISYCSGDVGTSTRAGITFFLLSAHR